LRDFVLACYGNLKFFAVIHMLAHFGESLERGGDPQFFQMRTMGLGALGYEDIVTVIERVARNGYDVGLILDLCKRFDIGFDDLLRYAAKKPSWSIKEIGDSANAVILNIKQHAVADWKDCEPVICYVKEIQTRTGMALAFDYNLVSEARMSEFLYKGGFVIETNKNGSQALSVRHAIEGRTVSIPLELSDICKKGIRVKVNECIPLEFYMQCMIKHRERSKRAAMTHSI
jgi:hypothetical protein